MKISDLVKIKEKLTKFSSLTFSSLLENKSTETNSYISNQLSSNIFGVTKEKFLDNLNKLTLQSDATDLALLELLQNVDYLIEEQAKDFYVSDYLINEIPAIGVTDVHNERQYRITICDQEIKQAVIAEIKKYTNFKYPALEIGPGDGQWTEFMVAADPLYLVDIHSEFLESTKSKFPIEYQRRLRNYLLGWHGVPAMDLSMLPQNQMSFVFAWQVFDFYALDKTKLYLEQCFNVMRPGGVMIFSYNNCEYSLAAAHAETGFKSWMPKKVLINTCKELGFEILTTEDTLSGFYWITIKKPGELKTIKASQSMGKIIS